MASCEAVTVEVSCELLTKLVTIAVPATSICEAEVKFEPVTVRETELVPAGADVGEIEANAGVRVVEPPPVPEPELLQPAMKDTLTRPSQRQERGRNLIGMTALLYRLLDEK